MNRNLSILISQPHQGRLPKLPPQVETNRNRMRIWYLLTFAVEMGLQLFRDGQATDEWIDFFTTSPISFYRNRAFLFLSKRAYT